MVPRIDIERFRAAARRRRRRVWVLSLLALTLILYAALCLYSVLTPSPIATNPSPIAASPSPLATNPSPITSPVPAPSSHRRDIVHNVSPTRLYSVSERSERSVLCQAQPVYCTSSAKPHVVSSAGASTPHSAAVSQRSGLTSNSAAVYYSFSATPSLARAFSRDTRQTPMRKAGRRSGFIDDPDPLDPSDPLANDPFMDDPDPLDPADPLNHDTPLGDTPLLFLLLFLLLYTLRRTYMTSNFC